MNLNQLTWYGRVDTVRPLLKEWRSDARALALFAFITTGHSLMRAVAGDVFYWTGVFAGVCFLITGLLHSRRITRSLEQ